jgi:5-methyltetrahydropteroyltriglutamate--homocysteine methyltransferase
MGFKMIPVTVVGSYPTSPTGVEIKNEIYKGRNAYRGAMREAIKDQIEAGVDVISDGQTRGDMVSIVASRIRGIRKYLGKWYVVNEIEWKGSIITEDLKFVRSVSPNPVQAIITGPYTLAANMEDRHHNDRKELVFELAKVINKELKNASNYTRYLHIDEPFFSVEFPEYARELVKKVFEGMDGTKMLHVCGDVALIYEFFLDFDVDVLDHEFKLHPELREVVRDFGTGGKIIGYGSVRSDNPKVESVKEISRHIREGLKVIEADKLWVDPDCGLKNLSREVAFNKLRNLSLARDAVMQREG